ncbi:hypothetical protein L6452_37176 [Arctium lappa]|uniref:Uncharacterized protein n=1 Tax=Arctium lappa TaxID=4217 RepID=A0ACB8Y2Y6_ARCLA|nr:hypothetical protein L6452_37176 [Arctium lappa]
MGLDFWRLICIASAISSYKKGRDACPSILPDGDFIKIFMDVPLCVCEARDLKVLYKLAWAEKIKEVWIQQNVEEVLHLTARSKMEHSKEQSFKPENAKCSWSKMELERNGEILVGS